MVVNKMLYIEHMNTISPKIRNEFQEYLVSYSVLRQIQTLFNNHDIDAKELPAESLPSGERRALIAKYYASIDWENPKSFNKVLRVYEDILELINDRIDRDSMYPDESFEKLHSRLVRWLQNDGFVYDGGKITFQNAAIIELEHDAVDLLDAHQFTEYVNRIKASIEDDPALAIGSTKELVEAVLKTVLDKLDGVDFDKDDDVPRLLKKAQKALKLAPDDIDNAAKGAEIIKILLSNLGSVVIKLAELRNLYGTGHGAEKRRKGMEPRHAKLAVGAGITLSSFLLDTFKSISTK